MNSNEYIKKAKNVIKIDNIIAEPGDLLTEELIPKSNSYETIGYKTSKK